MTANLIINVVSLLAAVVCTITMMRIYRLVGGRGRIVLIVAFAYMVPVRLLVISNLLLGTDYPVAELPLVFWVLMVVGLVVLLHEIHSTIKGG